LITRLFLIQTNFLIFKILKIYIWVIVYVKDLKTFFSFLSSTSTDASKTSL